jgi:hypothetical protein
MYSATNNNALTNRVFIRTKYLDHTRSSGSIDINPEENFYFTLNTLNILRHTD